MRPLPLLALCAALPACATLVDGTTEKLAVATDPPGAACALTRQGQLLATIPSTPGTVQVDRSRYELTILCQAPGREPARAFLRSGVRLGQAASAGDYLLAAGPAYAIDSLTGADRAYPAEITLTLPPRN